MRKKLRVRYPRIGGRAREACSCAPPRPLRCRGGSPISGAPSEKKDVTAAHDTENQRSGLTAALEDCRGHGAWRAISWGSKGQICSQRERGTPASGRVIPPRPSASPWVEPDTPSARSADVLPHSPRRRHPQTPAAVLCLRGAGCRVRGAARGASGARPGRKRWPRPAPRVSPAPVSTCPRVPCQQGIPKAKVTKTSSGFSRGTFCSHLRTNQSEGYTTWDLTRAFALVFNVHSLKSFEFTRYFRRVKKSTCDSSLF